MLIEPGSKLVMIGDSVTDCGRARPVGEGHDTLCRYTGCVWQNTQALPFKYVCMG